MLLGTQKTHSTIPVSRTTEVQAKMFSPTILQTPWSRVFLEKLIVTQLVKKLPTFYGT
jgi:hypothetical protein